MAGKPFKDKGLEVKSLDRSSHGIASAIWIDKLGPSRGARGGDPPPPGRGALPTAPCCRPPALPGRWEEDLLLWLLLLDPKHQVHACWSCLHLLA